MPPVNNQLGFQNFLSGKLTADVTSGATDIFIDTVPSVSEGFLVIDPLTPASREIIFFTSKTSTKVSVPAVGGRGVDGTSAVSHFNGTTYIMAPVAAWFTALQAGTISTDPLRAQLIANYVQSGGVVAQSAGLVGTFSNIICWIGGIQYSASSIANKTYTASKDTYVDAIGNSDGTVTVTYTEVANNATSPALTAGYMRIAIVVTGASAITSVQQYGFDKVTTSGQLNYVYNTSPQATPVFILPNSGSAGGSMYYRNQGGTKELWGTTASQAPGANGLGVTFPVGFFNGFTMPPIMGVSQIGGSWAQYVTAANIGVTGFITGYNGGGTGMVGTYLVRGY